jgi:hypothetical protein
MKAGHMEHRVSTLRPRRERFSIDESVSQAEDWTNKIPRVDIRTKSQQQLDQIND